MLTTTKSISAFLKGVQVNFAQDLTSRYITAMEAQVNVAPSEGEQVYEGTKLINNVWSRSDEHGTYRYYHIRIPKNSGGGDEGPFYRDPILKFPLYKVVESVGMTGWNWEQQQSMWVGFDFDSITGHAAGVGIPQEKLNEIQKLACNISWVQVRKSTGGSGLHLYVYFDPADLPQSENHHVHSAAARAVLGMMAREVNFDFSAQMDVCGGNMWVWHRKISEQNEGLKLIKDNTDFCPQLPENWRDNEEVIRGTRTKVRLASITDDKEWMAFEAESSARNKVALDPIHLKVEDRISQLGYTMVWVPDHHCWQTHTKAFQDLHEEFPDDYAGIYRTLSEGDDMGKPNCFAHPLNDGRLRITRFGLGAREDSTWTQDGKSWTWCYFNRDPSLREAASVFDGMEDPDNGSWVFTDFEDAKKVVDLMQGQLDINPAWVEMFGKDKKISLKETKDGSLSAEIERDKNDKPLDGWIEKRGKFQKKVHVISPDMEEFDITEYDGWVRALVAENGTQDAAWGLRIKDGTWVGHPTTNIKLGLKSCQVDSIDYVLGKLIMDPWKLVNIPFQPEYPGNRLWNRNGPQFAVQPADKLGPHPHWDTVLDHCGSQLNDALQKHPWATEHGVKTGREYLMLWVASMFRFPYAPLPYLFFYGPQNCGKSSFHESVATLMTKSGFMLADKALTSQGGFNSEIASAVLCAIEEVDLSEAKGSLERIKSWVTGVEMLIHPKRMEPFKQLNTTHWVHTSNYASAVPIFPGDTRITMIWVPPLTQEIPRHILDERLAMEAPSFLRSILDMRIPPAPGRLNIPFISTSSKEEAEEGARSALQIFIADSCHPVDGASVSLKDFYSTFLESLPKQERSYWPKRRVTADIRNGDLLLFGTGAGNQRFLGNVLLHEVSGDQNYGHRWIQSGERLIRSGE